MEEAAILKAIKDNPKIAQKELADIIGKSDGTVKRYMDAMQEKGIIQRKMAKETVNWKS